MKSRKTSLMLATILAAMVPGASGAGETIRIGTMATLEGPFTQLGQEAMRGFRLAINEAGGMVAGKTIEVEQVSSDGSPDSALKAVRKLVEQDGVKVVVGPLSGSEGITVKDYAKTQPSVTFVNGTSAAQETTLQEPAANFFRFTTDGVQWMAGLGDYVYNVKQYKTVATVAEDYSYPYSQVAGFMVPYCKLGGRVRYKAWVPIGNKDFSSIIAALPEDVDAIYVALAGADAINFLTQYRRAGGDLPLIAGTATVGQEVLSTKGRIRDELIGTPTAGPIPDAWDDPNWKAFVSAYRHAYPDGLPSPSTSAYTYYTNTKAALLGLEQVDGDLSDGGARLRDALARLNFTSPTGPVSIDHNRNGIANIFVSEVAVGDDGGLVKKVVKVVPNVNQTLGIPEGEFLKIGSPSRDNPDCP